eukprot:m.200177 g.200177  ORF g.200177 m.200177 type:complete len:303 (+) comp17691_c0_seq1:14-922(+)
MEWLQPYLDYPTTNVAWQQLWQPQSFRWHYGVTPFSHVYTLLGGIAFYLGTTFLLWAWMRGRAPMKVQALTQIHNAFLCFFSLAMHTGLVYSLWRSYETIYPGGSFTDLVCDPRKKMMQGPLAWWLYMFYLSKYYEMIDTFILALKKKPLTFLQMYHHGIIIVLTWTWMEGGWTTQWWGAVCNTLVHVFMYYYFALAAMGKTVWWKKYLTSAQLVQFASVFGMIFVWLNATTGGDWHFSSSWPFVEYAKGSICAGEMWVAALAQIVNVTFLILFGQLFIELYVSKKKPEKADAAAKKAKKTE